MRSVGAMESEEEVVDVCYWELLQRRGIQVISPQEISPR